MLKILPVHHKPYSSLFYASVKLIFACHICRSYGSVAKMLSVKQDKFGGSSELYLTQDRLKPEPGSNQILIRVHATALNRADLLMREGRYPNMKDVAHLGLEVAGVVESSNGESKWKMGDKVMALVNGGGYAEYVAVNQNHVMSIPPHLSFTDAAGIPEVWLTAYQLLHFVGKLKANETVLIHGGGSGVGTAAVQLVKLAGSRSIVTAGTEEKINVAKSLGAMDGINYKKGEFVEKVMEITNKKGVNVILDCVGGSYWKQNTECLATEGRWVLYGLLGGPKVDGNLLSSILGKRASLIGTTLKARSDEYKADLVAALAENALPHFKSDKSELRPVIDRIYPVKAVADAHDYMATNKSNGKIILSFDETGSHEEL